MHKHRPVDIEICGCLSVCMWEVPACISNFLCVNLSANFHIIIKKLTFNACYGLVVLCLYYLLLLVSSN